MQSNPRRIRLQAVMADVALFTDTYHEVNGVAKTFRRMASEFAKRGQRLHIFTYGPQEGKEDLGSVQVHTFRHQFSVGYYEKLRFEFWRNGGVMQAWRALHAAQPFQCVHIATPGSMGLMGRVVALRRQIPLLGSYHTHLAEYMAMRSWPLVAGPLRACTWSMLRWFYQPCRVVLTPTESTHRELQAAGFANRLDVFTRGIDTELFSPARRTRVASDRLRALYVGRIAIEKSVDQILGIVRGLDVEIELVGDGPERAAIQRDLPAATFHGYKLGEDLASIYANADVFLFPSRTDTFGNVVLEAMASGLVPVVADAPGPRDYVTHGKNALVCADVGAMRAALQDLQSRPDLRAELAEGARAFALRRDWCHAVDQLTGAYARVAAEA